MLITAISFISAAFWAVLQYRQRNKDKRFEAYHDLIDQLVNEQRNPDRAIKLDRQVAIVFELRNFASYYPVSIRILEGFRDVCENERIIKEIDLTVEYMNSSFLKRCYWRFDLQK